MTTPAAAPTSPRSPPPGSAEPAPAATRPAVRPASDRYVPLLLFALLALVYGAFCSNHHYFDSIHYARITESADSLFWQKHILQHGLVRWLWWAQGQIAASTTTLRVAQWVNAFAAAGAVTFTYLTLRRSCGTLVAAAGALLLGFTGVVARHAIEGEEHVLPLCFLALGLWIAVSVKRDLAAGVWVGLSAAASILMHQFYLVFVPALVGALIARGASRKAVAVMLLCTALPCAATYGIVFHHGNLPWGQLPRWLVEEAGIAGWRADSFPNAGRALLNALSPSGNHLPAIRADNVIPAIVLLGLTAQGVRMCRQKTAPVLWFSLLAAAFSIPAIAWHQPDFQYFCPMALAVVLPATLGLGSLPRWLGVPMAWTLALLQTVASLGLLLRPAHDASSNDMLSRARFVAQQATRRDLVLSTGTGAATGDVQYLPYFARTNAVTLWEARTRYGDERLMTGLRTLIDEKSVAGGRLLAFADLVTPGRSFVGFLDTPLPLGGSEIRAALALDYDFVEVATYRGAGYEEVLVELRPRQSESTTEGRPCGLGCPFRYECVSGSCRCGPHPHFQKRGNRCLPSCGVLLNQEGRMPEASACCEHPCASIAAFSSQADETWDCRYCCGGKKGDSLCGGPTR